MSNFVHQYYYVQRIFVVYGYSRKNWYPIDATPYSSNHSKCEDNTMLYSKYSKRMLSVLALIKYLQSFHVHALPIVKIFSACFWSSLHWHQPILFHLPFAPKLAQIPVTIKAFISRFIVVFGDVHNFHQFLGKRHPTSS
jgi:hypothetical protein